MSRRVSRRMSKKDIEKEKRLIADGDAAWKAGKEKTDCPCGDFDIMGRAAWFWGYLNTGCGGRPVNRPELLEVTK